MTDETKDKSAARPWVTVLSSIMLVLLFIQYQKLILITLFVAIPGEMPHPAVYSLWGLLGTLLHMKLYGHFQDAFPDRWPGDALARACRCSAGLTFHIGSAALVLILIRSIL